jgi:hypothetical protein
MTGGPIFMFRKETRLEDTRRVEKRKKKKTFDKEREKVQN